MLTRPDFLGCMAIAQLHSLTARLHCQDREREKNLELIKKQYLGADKVKKKMLKPSEKFKFNFDWEASDDTSRDLNPLYNSTHEATLLFGSGSRAGMDRREQKKEAAEHKAQLLRKMREAQVCGHLWPRAILQLIMAGISLAFGPNGNVLPQLQVCRSKVGIGKSLYELKLREILPELAKDF